MIYVNDLRTPHHKQNSLSQFADDTAQWVFSLDIRFAAKFLQRGLLGLAVWCARWRVKLNPEKARLIIFSGSILARKIELGLKLYGEALKVYPQVKFLGIAFDSQLNFKGRFEGILGRCDAGFSFGNYCPRLCRRRGSAAPKRICSACPSFTKIHLYWAAA